MKNKSTIESQVRINSIHLESRLDSYLKTHHNQYVIFNNNEAEFVSTFSEGVKKGIILYGENTGFVVKKVSKSPAVLSSLVKL